MPILRAGPWGNLTDSFQAVPLYTTAALDYYPVNCAKADWPNQPWTAWYEVEESGCNGPETITSTTFISGNVQLTKQAGDGCTYYWVNGFGAYYGEVTIWYASGQWQWEENQSYVPFETATGGTDPNDPTGTYTGTFSNYTVTTP